jgi:hypothetical protein
MYSKQEASKLKHQFWTSFGLYLAPVLSADGEKINWLNYKTGIKYIHFRMDADSRKAYIGIEISHPDKDIQELFFQHFQQLRKILEETVDEQWIWKLHNRNDHGKTISSIYTELSPVNIFDKQDWPALISFFKPRIIALDEWWSQVKYAFEALQ